MRGRRGLAREAVAVLAVATAIGLPVRCCAAQSYQVESTSMTPTLQPGDRVIVVKPGDAQPGDIVVAHRQEPGLRARLGLGGGMTPVIKRVVGVGGDVIEIRSGQLFRNGQAVEEPYLTQDASDLPELVVPDDHVYLLGDNRAGSDDSRGTLGPVPSGHVVGRALLRIVPRPGRLSP